MAIWLVPPPRDRATDLAVSLLAFILVALAVGVVLGETISVFIR
jgi:hypothetical protein